MRRRNRKDLKRRVIQAKDSPRRHWSEAISPERGWFRLGEISPVSTSKSHPSEDGFAWARSVQRAHQICAQARCFHSSEKSLIQNPKECIKRNFRVLERGSGLGGTKKKRKRTRTTEDSCSSLGNLSSLKCNGYYE